jgi:hypothetical protein
MTCSFRQFNKTFKFDFDGIKLCGVSRIANQGIYLWLQMSHACDYYVQFDAYSP